MCLHVLPVCLCACVLRMHFVLEDFKEVVRSLGAGIGDGEEVL